MYGEETLSFSSDLLEQARHLAERDTGRPKQANLKRASSAAYYALFHFLAWEAALIIPKTPAGLRNRVCRAFQHGEMKQVCLPFSRGTLSPAGFPLLKSAPSSELRFVEQTFVELQGHRHKADYDLDACFYRSDTLQDIDNADAAMATWAKIRHSDEAVVFAALAFGARWSK